MALGLTGEEIDYPLCKGKRNCVRSFMLTASDRVWGIGEHCLDMLRITPEPSSLCALSPHCPRQAAKEYCAWVRSKSMRSVLRRSLGGERLFLHLCGELSFVLPPLQQIWPSI